MAKYRVRYFFDPGADICLWAANEAARERFGYPIEVKQLRELGLPENTWRKIIYLCAWYDTSIDWSYPPNPSPWDEDETARFINEAQKLLSTLRQQLGKDFEIVDESKTTRPLSPAPVSRPKSV